MLPECLYLKYFPFSGKLKQASYHPKSYKRGSHPERSKKQTTAKNLSAERVISRVADLTKNHYLNTI